MFVGVQKAAGRTRVNRDVTIGAESVLLEFLLLLAVKAHCLIVTPLVRVDERPGVEPDQNFVLLFGHFTFQFETAPLNLSRARRM